MRHALGRESFAEMRRFLRNCVGQGGRYGSGLWAAVRGGRGLAASGHAGLRSILSRQDAVRSKRRSPGR